MLVIDKDKTIHLTRGDVAAIEIRASNEEGEAYTFSPGDVVRFKVFERKDCNCVVLTKDAEVEEAAEAVTVHLTSEDTKLGDPINKPREYWYEVEINPETAPQTIIGYDKDGEKVFKLYPEGSDPE